MTVQGSPGRAGPAAALGAALAHVRAVAWSFFGIRRGSRARDDVERLRPVPLVVAGVLLAAAFVGGLVSVARLAAAGLGA
ncbi:DUF2970 domain-containing protein [Piscinibacter sakaiensis]|uniref:DUF2970 domain-containing protein n=1 Tax=Piscinibacter sakaiensis TaxID=1547922 RepID=UPI0009E9ED43|nr:DUF2970 domain-containing protein [Piscinibacter sakaiensis]